MQYLPLSCSCRVHCTLSSALRVHNFCFLFMNISRFIPPSAVHAVFCCTNVFCSLIDILPSCLCPELTNERRSCTVLFQSVFVFLLPEFVLAHRVFFCADLLVTGETTVHILTVMSINFILYSVIVGCCVVQESLLEALPLRKGTQNLLPACSCWLQEAKTRVYNEQVVCNVILYVRVAERSGLMCLNLTWKCHSNANAL